MEINGNHQSCGDASGRKSSEVTSGILSEASGRGHVRKRSCNVDFHNGLDKQTNGGNHSSKQQLSKSQENSAQSSAIYKGHRRSASLPEHLYKASLLKQQQSEKQLSSANQSPRSSLVHTCCTDSEDTSDPVTAASISAVECDDSKILKSFHKHFPRLDDIPIKNAYYSCALVRDSLPMHGRLFVTPTHICFNASKIFKKEISIKFTDVVSITKENTALVVPNAVKVATTDNKYTFGWLMNRHSVFKILTLLWAKNNCKAQIDYDQISMSSKSDHGEFCLEETSAEDLNEEETYFNRSAADMPQSNTIKANFDFSGSGDSPITNTQPRSSSPIPKTMVRGKDDGKRSQTTMPETKPFNYCDASTDYSTYYTINHTTMVHCVIAVVGMLSLFSAILAYKMYCLRNILIQHFEEHTFQPFGATVSPEMQLFQYHSAMHWASMEQMSRVMSANNNILASLQSSIAQLAQSVASCSHHFACVPPQADGPA